MEEGDAEMGELNEATAAGGLGVGGVGGEGSMDIEGWHVLKVYSLGSCARS